MSETLTLVGVEFHQTNPLAPRENWKISLTLQFSTVEDGDYEWNVPDHLAPALAPLLFDDPTPDYRSLPVGIPDPNHDPCPPRQDTEREYRPQSAHAEGFPHPYDPC